MFLVAFRNAGKSVTEPIGWVNLDARPLTQRRLFFANDRCSFRNIERGLPPNAPSLLELAEGFYRAR